MKEKGLFNNTKVTVSADYFQGKLFFIMIQVHI